MICKNCGFPKGKHTVELYCPADNTFRKYTRKKFRLQVDLVASGKSKAMADLEREVARRVLKALETNLGLYDLTGPSTFDRVQLLENLQVLKAGYEVQ